MHDVKTKFGEYICFDATTFDTTPEADNDGGYIDVDVVTLDGEFTLDDLRNITKGMEQRIVEKV